MSDYAKYYVGPVSQVLAAIGFILGGNYVWIGIALFPTMVILDAILPRDYSVRKMKSRALAYIPIWIVTLFGPGLYLVMAWSVAHHSLTTWQLVGSSLSCLWLSVLPFVPAVHELYHAPGSIGRSFARYTSVAFFDCTRLESHVTGHHLHVATSVDTDTASRGETLYGFALRAVIGTIKQSIVTENALLRKRGLSRWSPQSKLVRAVFAQIVFFAILYAMGGWAAVWVGVGASLGARYMMETFNYFQHYGLVRVPNAPIAKRHVWNHLGMLSRLVGFEITNHVDHHINSYPGYHELVPDRDSMPMPSVFTCFLIALLPPVWNHGYMKPALKHWDEQIANAEERVLAAEQSREAGWTPSIPIAVTISDKDRRRD